MSGVSYAFEMWRDPFDVLTMEGATSDMIRLAQRGRDKLIAAALDAEVDRRWEDALGKLGRNRGPLALDAWWPDLTIEEKKRLILYVWETDDSPVWSLGERRWLAMFKEVGFVSDGPERPHSSLAVWRGATVASRGRGMSWSIDREQAESFAARWRERFRIPAILYAAVVPPQALLAFSGFAEGSRGEREVIVNPNMLRGRISPVREGGHNDSHM
jgi:hypothetical protein